MYGQSSGYSYQDIPTILLKGHWLKEFDFDINSRIKVSCEQGKLVIEPDPDYKDPGKDKISQCISEYQLDKLSKSELRLLEKSLQTFH